MANIAISDLRPTGANLFQDSESFLNELTEQEIADVLGGGKIAVEILWSGICGEISW
ncbi:hypothetical protein H6G97_25240 [Nostoc flagelliforme FACHB-838]|uniref:Uncharacterized protein n=1 Tax=Nostoc flagelliforme FACHB-838 TaxID=2692904 RepID=A0ABR8DV20_9NOSO|nr:hypothetical protein [Nostoc flagelliforme]MBD2532707.1 hypothetical protein [Nostoc flagelliforme FACHB-838]